MLPYGIVFSLLSLTAFLNRKSTKNFSLIAFIFLILFYAFRNHVGTDWSGYEYYFDNVYDKYVTDTYSFEKGYWALNYATSYFLGSYRYLVLLVGIFNGILFWKATNKYTKNIGIVMLLSLFYLFFPTLEAFRQSITLFLFYYSLEYVEQNPKKYILLNVIGLLFHITGIFTLVFFIFNKYKVARRVIVLTLLFWGVFESFIFKMISVFPLVATKYYWYFHIEKADTSLVTLKTLEYLLIAICYFIAFRRTTLTEREKLYANLIFLGFIIQITLGQMSNIAYRMTYFTDIGVILTYSLIYDKIKAPVYKYLYIVALIIYTLLRFYSVFHFDDPRFIYSL